MKGTKDDPVTLAELVALDPPSGGTKSPINPLRHADVVMAFQGDNPKPSLFYGAETLQQIVDDDSERAPAVLYVRIAGDQTTEMEQLAAMLEVLRGRCDYQGATEH